MMQFTALINRTISGIIIAVAAVTPLLFLDKTSEFFETPKLIFLIASVLILLLLWSLSWIIQGRVQITKTPLDLPLLLLLLVVIISTVFSETKFVSIYGNFPRFHGSAVTWITYILFYFIVVSNIKTASQVRNIFYALGGSTLIVLILTLASYFGFYLPFAFAKIPSFTPTGSSFSTAALAVMLLPFSLISTIHPDKFLPLPISILFSVVAGLVIVLIGGLPVLVIALLGVFLVLFFSKQADIIKSLPLLLISAVIAGIVFIGGFISTDRNILYKKQAEFAKFREIQLPFNFSWKVSASAFRDDPFKGTGPSTYLFNFTSYKPAEINVAKVGGVELWNLRFDTAFNEYLQMLGTVGILGFLAFAFFSVIVLVLGWNGLMKKQGTPLLSDTFVPALSISAITAIGLMLIHVTTPVMLVSTLLILAILMSAHKSVSGRVEDLLLGIKTSKLTGINNDASLVLSVALFIPIVLLVIFVSFFLVGAVKADLHHHKALTIPVSDGVGIYTNLRDAAVNNERIDTYHIDLAQVYFALANSIAASKGPTEASPGGSLTDTDKTKIQQFLSQAISEARIASAITPRSALNWEVMASIYRQISGVAQNALSFSLDAYGRAIQRDPLNPQLRLNVGGVYYSVKNYDLAIRFFTDAINLKPDFANAYYNLAVALSDKGDLAGAAASIEQVVRLVDPKSQDYKVATELLKQFKDRAATASAGQANTQAGQVPPAAEQKAPLQQKELPQINVLDKEKPDNIATPEAVKR